MTEDLNLTIVLEKYYGQLYELWHNLEKNNLISNPGNGLRMPTSRIKEIFKLFPNESPATIINNTNHYSCWYGTMGHMARILNEPETHRFLINMGLDTSIEDYYGDNSNF